MDVSEKKKAMIQYAEKYPEGSFEIQAERTYKKCQSFAEEFAEEDRIKVESTPYKKSGFFCRKNGTINIFLKIGGKWKTYITAEFFFLSVNNSTIEFHNEIEGNRDTSYSVLNISDKRIAENFYGAMGVLNGNETPKEHAW